MQHKRAEYAEKMAELQILAPAAHRQATGAPSAAAKRTARQLHPTKVMLDIVPPAGAFREQFSDWSDFGDIFQMVRASGGGRPSGVLPTCDLPLHTEVPWEYGRWADRVQTEEQRERGDRLACPGLAALVAALSKSDLPCRRPPLCLAPALCRCAQLPTTTSSAALSA